jgi:hypothetical protein
VVGVKKLKLRSTNNEGFSFVKVFKRVLLANGFIMTKEILGCWRFLQPTGVEYRYLLNKSGKIIRRCVIQSGKIAFIYSACTYGIFNNPKTPRNYLC